MDCSPPGSSVHGDSPGKNTGVYGVRKCSSFILLQVGNTCKPMAVSFQFMTKSTTNKKKIIKKNALPNNHNAKKRDMKKDPKLKMT